MKHENTVGDSTLNASAEILLHDLRGPLLNVKNFHEEMSDAVVRMQALLPSDDTRLSSVDNAELKALLAQDLSPCLDFAIRAVKQMHERVARFEKLYSEPDER